MAMTSQAAARRNRRNRSRTGIAQAGLYHVHPPAAGERHTYRPCQRITGRSCGVNITRGLIANLLELRAFAGAPAAPSHAAPIAWRPYRMPPLSRDRVGLVLGVEPFPIQVVVPAGAVRQRALKALVSAGGGRLASHAGAGFRDGRTGTPHDDGAGP